MYSVQCSVGDFVAGLDLNEQFYNEVVQPTLAAEFPGLLYSAARLGDGSDVLGFDDEMSTDHDWGLRQQIFLDEKDHERWATAVSQTLAQALPSSFRGYSVHFGEPDAEGTRIIETIESGPLNHRVTVDTISQFFEAEIGLAPEKEWDAIAWVSVPQQRLLQVTAGRVFYDGLAELEPMREKFAYFPHEVWLYLLACQWRRIGQEDHFVGRTGFRGDDIGSRLLAARLVLDVMMLGFLYEKQYAPYPKWFGSAFKRLRCADELEPVLEDVLTAVTWQEREANLCHAYTIVGELHNHLQLTAPLPTGCEPFHGRPFQVHAAGYSAALRAAITDETVLSLPAALGSIDQISDNTDLRSFPKLFKRLRPLYG